MTAASDAERMVAEVRDDPAARIQLAADTYALRGVRVPTVRTGGPSSRSCGGSRRGVYSTRWTQTRRAVRGGAWSTKTCCATRLKRSFSSNVRLVRRRGPA